MSGEAIHHTPGFPVARVGMSINDYVALLTKQRWSHEAKGLVLLLPRTGIVVVPFERAGGGGWNCVTLHDPRGVYPRDGYNIYVGDGEIETAAELSVPTALVTA